MEDETTIVPPLSEVAASNGQKDPETLLDQLRLAREEIAQSKETFIKVPGYAEKGLPLYIKYRLLEGEELAKIGKRAQNTKDRWRRNVDAATDTLIVACEGLYLDLANEGNEDEYTQLTIDGEPVLGFSVAVATRLGIQISEQSPARSVVMGLFGGNELAVLQHSMLLQRWMGNTNLDVNEELIAGEL